MHERLLKQFQDAEQRARPWYEFSGGVWAKLRRIRFLKQKYLIFTLHRFGLKEEAVATLFFGKRLRLPLSDPNARRIYFMGTLGVPRERALTAFLCRTVRPTDVFYDVGASFGFYSFLMGAGIEGGEVHAFEANDRVYQYLRENTHGTHIHPVHVAVQNTPGTATFYDSITDSSSSSLLKAADRDADAYAAQTVTATTLDQYVKTHTPPTVVKIDVEGAELSVLQGGEDTLRHHKPIIILEVWGKERGKKHHANAVAFLEERGYTPHTITLSGVLEKCASIDFDAITRYENIVFTYDERETSAAQSSDKSTSSDTNYSDE